MWQYLFIRCVLELRKRQGTERHTIHHSRGFFRIQTYCYYSNINSIAMPIAFVDGTKQLAMEDVC